MTFLATVDGQLVPGGPYGSGWPRPWAFRCDGCGAILPYRCVITRSDRRTSIDQARVEGADRHLCGACDGFTEQIGLWS
jgi:hypothetical protein